MIAKLILVVAALTILTLGIAQVYKAGGQAERTAALTKGVKLVQERDQLNVQVRTATAADICHRLGGVMSDSGECD